MGRFSIVCRLVFGGRAEFTNVGNVGLITGEPHRFKNLIEFRSCWSDERFLFLFLLIARGFANEHEIGFGIAGREDHGVPKASKGTGRLPSFGDGCEGGDLFGWRASGGKDGGAIGPCGGGGLGDSP